MQKMKFLPILLGSDENAYGCARLFFDEYKIKSLLLCCRALPPTSHSRILYRKIIDNFDTNAVFKGIAEEFFPILKEKAEKLLVIPCSDYYTELTVKNREIISRFSDVPIIPDEVYKKICDKKAFYTLCKEKGLPFPETVILSPEELLNLPLPFNFPIIIKPANSNSFNYLHAKIKNRKKVYFCNSKGDIKTVSENFISAGYSDALLIQQYISGNESLVINAYCDDNAKVRVIGAAKPILEYRTPSLIGNYAALQTVKKRNICDTVISFLEEIKYKGFANFDLKYDSKKSRYVFFELNPRQGRSSYCMHTAGENLMKIMCDDVVYGKRYNGVIYAERAGIWSNVPKYVLKRYSGNLIPEIKNIDSAFGIKGDFSPMRVYTLVKRDLGAYKMFSAEKT